jgi:hypothetical protein
VISVDSEALKTCLYDRHVALGAKVEPFAGFLMPIQYHGIVQEHNAVRQNVGMSSTFPTWARFSFVAKTRSITSIMSSPMRFEPNLRASHLWVFA